MGFRRKLSPDGKQTVEVPGAKKEVIRVRRQAVPPGACHQGRRRDPERAWKADKAGNCVFRYTTRAFAGLCARAARLTIVEVSWVRHGPSVSLTDARRLRTLSRLARSRNGRRSSGIYVDRIVPATVEKKIEFVTLREESHSDEVPAKKDAARMRREKIAKRAALELKDGYYCNLGVGMPVLAASFLPEGGVTYGFSPRTHSRHGTIPRRRRWMRESTFCSSRLPLT